MKPEPKIGERQVFPAGRRFEVRQLCQATLWRRILGYGPVWKHVGLIYAWDEGPIPQFFDTYEEAQALCDRHNATLWDQGQTMKPFFA